jgi:membrane-associated phospholipid phosphatase
VPEVSRRPSLFASLPIRKFVYLRKPAGAPLERSGSGLIQRLILNKQDDILISSRFKPHDLVFAALALVFAAFSLIWPNTAGTSVGELPRGYRMALAFLGIAAFCLLAGRLESAAWSKASKLKSKKRADALRGAASFVRTYYPQAFIAAFFTESILLSAQALGGLSHDDFFMAADQRIFGFQPAREFSKIFGGLPWLNEIMFGVYFLYFAFMAVAIWIPFLKGNRAEGERQMFTVAALMAVACVWYVFFRVQGPKYWLPDLRAAWYDSVEGGLFVGLFQRSLATTTLSGAAFPSTHVILTLTTLAFARRNDRRYFHAYLPIAFLILCSTVYIYAHWAVDILGGMLFALILAPLFYRAYEGARRRIEASAFLGSTRAGLAAKGR